MIKSILKFFQKDNSKPKEIYEAIKMELPLNEIETMISSGLNLDLKDESGLTALHYAVESGKLETVKLLLENKANPNIGDNDMVTPYNIAKSYSGLEDIVELLLKHGADPKILDKHGKNYLM